MTAYDLVLRTADDASRVLDMDLSDADAAAVSAIVARLNETSGFEVEFGLAEPRPASGVCDECFDPFGPTDRVARNWLGEWIHHACLGGAA